MLFSSTFSPFIAIAVTSTVVFIVVYCVRVNRAHRHIAPYPAQVVVVTRPNQYPSQYPSQYPQMCWTVSMEQPPPPYNAAVTAMNTNRDIVHINNES